MSVQCGNCAMLAVINPSSSKRVEANKHFRNTGTLIYSDSGRFRNTRASVICIAGMRDDLELLPASDGPELINGIRVNIECDTFEQYRQGVGPEEIEAMNSTQAALEVKEKLLALNESVFAWRREQAERDAAFGEKLHAIGRTQAWGSKWQAIATLITAIIAIAALMGWGRH